MNWIKKLLGIDQQEQSRLIEDRFNKLQEKVLAEVATLRSENFSLKNEVNQKNNRITELLEKLRDQNEADLLLECKRIEKRVIEGEKKQDINLGNFNALQNISGDYSRQLALQRNIGIASSLGSLFGR